MLLAFQVCFFVGVGLTLLSLIFGSLFEALGIDGLDIDFDLFGFDFFLPLSPILYILFSTVFGGVGWILIDTFPGMEMVIRIIIAVVVGIIISSLVNQFVMKPLRKAQNTSAPNAEELVGVRATVTETIPTGGFGEISYVVKGSSFTSPAKTTNGKEIKVGKDVAICWIEDYIYYVTNLGDI